MHLYQNQHLVSNNQPFKINRQAYYMIICKANQQALRVEQPDTSKHYKSRVIGSQINPQDNCQIFMLYKPDTSSQEYQIVCCASDYVFENDSKQVLLYDGKKGKNQLWKVSQVFNQNKTNNLHQYFHIKCSHYPDQALSLEGSLRVSAYDPGSLAQQFRFQQVNNITIQNSCVLVNNYSLRALDVPAGTDKNGQRIVIWDRNNRWNQRWYFWKSGNGFLIKSLLTGQCLDIAGESRQDGAKVVQWPQTGGTNQLWHIEQAGNKIYKIWSLHDPALCLAIRKQDGDNGAYLQVSKKQNPTMYWRIEGAKPK